MDNIFEKYLDPEEAKAYRITLDLIGLSEFNDHNVQVCSQLSKIEAYSFIELCNGIRNGDLFLLFYENISQGLAEEIEKNEFEDFPSVESFKSFSFKIFSWVVVQGSYEQLGLNDALKLVDCMKAGYRRISLLLVLPEQEEIYAHCERLKNDLIKIDNEREFFYWYGSSGKLQILHDLLKDKGYIKENKSFIDSFKNETVSTDLRTEWVGSMRDLVFVTNFLFKRLFGKSFYKKTHKLFFIKEIKYSIDSLRWTYHQIKHEFQNPESSKRKELLEIIENIVS